VRLVEETARHGPGDEGIATAVGFDDALWMFAVNGVDPILGDSDPSSESNITMEKAMHMERCPKGRARTCGHMR